MMIYLAGSFFIYIFANQLDQHILNQFWFLTNAFYCLMCMLFILSFKMYLKKIKPIIASNLQPSLN